MRLRRIALVVLIVCLSAGSSFANMKKGKVAGGGSKGFTFSTSSDGFCTVSAIYDKTSSQLGVAFALQNGDLLCVGLSSQNNFQSCTAGLPAGDYFLVVASVSGASTFRVVVNCSGQESVSAAAGTITRGIEIKEISDDRAVLKLGNQLRSILEKSRK